MTNNTRKQKTEKYNGRLNVLTNTQLKYIGFATMLADHITKLWVQPFMQGSTTLFYLNSLLSALGRMAFPIFAFLVVEAVTHTKNIIDYIGRLLLFTLIAQLPYNYFLTGDWFNISNGFNVMATLTFGAFGAFAIQIFHEQKSTHVTKNPYVALVLLLFASLILVDTIHVDYGILGVLTIWTIAFSRHYVEWQVISGYIFLDDSIYSALGFLTYFFYNGERGKSSKWFGYWFYPAHMIIIRFVFELIK